MTDAEIETALARSGLRLQLRIESALKLLQEKKPQQPSPKVAKALEPLMLHGELWGIRAGAAKLAVEMGHGGSVPAPSRGLRDEFTPVRSDVMEALVEYKPPEAIKPASGMFAPWHDAGAAGKYLKAVGPDAEDVVLAVLESSKDAWVVSEVCGILEVIGTKKSLPALENGVKDDNWMIELCRPEGAERGEGAAVDGYRWGRRPRQCTSPQRHGSALRRFRVRQLLRLICSSHYLIRRFSSS